MPVNYIDASCNCDGCGKAFRIEIDSAVKLSEVNSAEELVRDAITNSCARCYVYGIRGKHTLDRFDLNYTATIQGGSKDTPGMLLCDECSRKCDEVPISRALTMEEVKEALGLIEV